MLSARSTLLGFRFHCCQQDDLKRLMGKSMDTLRQLTDGFGGRVSGTPAYNGAVEWAARKFREAGIKNVRLEPFTIPNGWQRGPARGGITKPIQRAIHIESLGWSPSTPAGGVKGEVWAVEDISPEKLQAHAADIRDHIVLLDRKKVLGEEPRNVLPKLHAAYQQLKDLGAQALVFQDREADNVLNATTGDWNAKLHPLPVAEIGMEEGKLIQRLLESGPVTMELELQNRTSGPTQINNVIAEMRGSERPDEWIIVGAHLDSWDYGTGAQDNGTGTVMVLEAARALADLGKAPRRSIRFALWGGEEEGLIGSHAYVDAHRAELARCVAALNTDNGAGHPKGWKVEGRKDLEVALKPISDRLLKGLSGGDVSQRTSFSTDHGFFMLEGIPAFDLWVDMTHYEEIHHKSSDTFDKVDPMDFKDGAAIVAVTAWAMAQTPEPIAPHIDHAAVGQILKKADLDEFLSQLGFWKP